MCFSDISPLEQLDVIKDAGFDGFFNDKVRGSDYKPTEALSEKAARLGLYYQSIHAPFYGMDDIWHDDSGELAAKMELDLLNSIEDCARFDVPIAVMHAIIGMDRCTPNEQGLNRLEKVIDRAVARGVTIAFENTEGEMYLEAILKRFGHIDNVGFCIDTGHEMCYNYSRDLIGKYGDLLVSTHLNDNLGITGEEITFLDDCHLLPFDGVADWKGIADRLNKCGYGGDLTFEINSKGREGRDTNKRYESMSIEEYVAEAYRKAVQFHELINT